ncbi:STAS domain-containing protein [Pelotomaculum propionicicum]|uniref:Anti-sigma factor antagonist n=1 Tax=Pelotomaculum propionicicum TaxID=258475 RepID=A0A4Y7RWF3_9FIRM|nr:STAS domain-containing protein [Pelotomaculum propionicicum]NLI13317.1 STAS domain-containing protein [Peptococcaceae bacterium]TEB13183.1 putative anti-sigma factor antagonist BtrV [Pelotomaculum propionicicum]
MKIQESKSGSVIILELNGRLDASTSGILEKKLMDSLDGGEKFFILDFNQLDYISSAGLRVLLMAAKKTNGIGGKVALSCLKEHVKEVFDIAGFTAIFPICFTQEDAAKLF